MIRACIFCLLILAFVAAPASSARALVDMLTVDLAEDHVDITTGFTGADLVLFGMAAPDTHVAVVMRGPKRDVVIRHKERFMGAWMNRESMKFENVPLFYDYAVSVAEETLMEEEKLKEYGIGMQSLLFTPESSADTDPKTLKSFQAALIKNRQKEQLFPLKPKNIDFLNTQLFKIKLHVPANVPTGVYDIQTFLIKDKNVKEVHTTKLTVAQIGFSAGIYKFAHERAFAYAMLCLFLATFAGWFSNRVGHKD